MMQYCFPIYGAIDITSYINIHIMGYILYLKPVIACDKIQYDTVASVVTYNMSPCGFDSMFLVLELPIYIYVYPIKSTLLYNINLHDLDTYKA